MIWRRPSNAAGPGVRRLWMDRGSSVQARADPSALRPSGWRATAARWPIPRAEVAARSHGFQETNVGQLAVTVPEEIEGAILRALGFGKRFVEARGLSPSN